MAALYFSFVGFRAQESKLGGDGGIDIRLYKGREDHPAALVQCKAWSPRADLQIEVLRAFFFVLGKANVGEGYMIATCRIGGFLKKEAKQQNVKVWTAEDFCRQLRSLSIDYQNTWLNAALADGYNIPTCTGCGTKHAPVDGKAPIWRCPKCSLEQWMRREDSERFRVTKKPLQSPPSTVDPLQVENFEGPHPSRSREHPITPKKTPFPRRWVLGMVLAGLFAPVVWRTFAEKSTRTMRRAAEPSEASETTPLLKINPVATELPSASGSQKPLQRPKTGESKSQQPEPVALLNVRKKERSSTVQAAHALQQARVHRPIRLALTTPTRFAIELPPRSTSPQQTRWMIYDVRSDTLLFPEIFLSDPPPEQAEWVILEGRECYVIRAAD